MVRPDRLLVPAESEPGGLAGEPALRDGVEGAMEPDPLVRPAAAALPRRPAAPLAEPPAFAEDPLSAFCARRNLLCTIVFIDLVGYSMRPVDEQVAAKEAFKSLMVRALQDLADDSRLAIDTGDGAAVCFVGDPVAPLRLALRLRQLMQAHRRPALEARIGLHLGPVRVVSDINDRANVVGDGINVAQRVMGFAQPQQVLVSSAYRDVVCRLVDGAAPLFRYLGPFRDKHGRVHEVHAVHSPEGLLQPPPPGAADGMPTADAVQALERELAHDIGPVARVLVARAQRRAGSLQALREVLSTALPEAAAREVFLAAGAPAASRPAGNASRFDPPSQPAGRRQTRHRSGTRAVARQLPRGRLTRGELARLQHLLSRQIGPLAKVLLARELDLGHEGDELLDALAGHLDTAEQRAAFRLAVLRDLGEPAPR